MTKPTREFFQMPKMLPDLFPLPEDLTCVEIMIPNDPEYLYLLQGFVAAWTKYWNWAGTGDDRKDHAALCQVAYDATDWEQCMNCEEVAECIDENEATRDALGRFVSGFDGDFRNGEGGFNQDMSAEERAANLAAGSNPTCDDDILFAQCRFVIDETHTAILQVLRQVEVLSNVGEIVKNLWDSVPLVATVDDVSGANGVVNLALYWQEAVAESYEAQFTLTVGGLRDKLAYALFCRCRPDCEITINRILWMYENQLKQYIAPPNLSGLFNLIETLAGVAQDTSFVVELAHYAAWGLVKVARYFFGRKYDNVLGLLIKIKADEPSDDWEALEIIFGACKFEVFVRADAFVTTTGDPLLNGNDTDFDVVAATSYGLNTIGTWNYGAEGPVSGLGHATTNPSAIVPSAGLARIVYKIGISGTWQATDDSFEFTASASGRLYLACNDVPGAYNDNSGFLTCDIQEV